MSRLSRRFGMERFPRTSMLWLLAAVLLTGGAGGFAAGALSATVQEEPAETVTIDLEDGPQGPAGPAGPAGPPGPAGPAGQGDTSSTGGKCGPPSRQGRWGFLIVNHPTGQVETWTCIIKNVPK